MTVWIMHDLQYVHQHAVGFSGVIFTLALMECYGSTVPTRSIFGILQVPTKLYPWALLCVLSVRKPEKTSALCHYVDKRLISHSGKA